ncbi:hypothetical protein DL89DRAFT_290458 [Linderina pennispora]|uniref:Myb-like domain-containing protein n=1 Tax=Linderina pennispora TaxID=61395 RepID=A0A1Y1WP10_9FUNG|nr:uncharacterized protein DL89DRAFT_290458 [Linderina pennispora]ORX75028.1 hypothetical protein DL89DRAFT_290458 [Linderina pennispora]
MPPTEQLSEYEQQRLENIRRNREILQSLNIGDGPLLGAAPARIRGESADEVTKAEEQVIESNDATEFYHLPTEHFSTDVVKKAVHVDGHYTGWVEPGVMQRLGIKGSATEAWESEGGGKFSFKDPLGTGKKISKRALPAGQSAAKYVSSQMLRKNPNAYFYRNTEPGVDQWTGDWTDEERDLFIETATEFGCGDKWGLFSTYIPHRVGYQCSNFYRQCIIPEGWVIDDNYRLDSGGKAVYVGNHKRRGAK